MLGYFLKKAFSDVVLQTLSAQIPMEIMLDNNSKCILPNRDEWLGENLWSSVYMFVKSWDYEVKKFQKTRNSTSFVPHTRKVTTWNVSTTEA